MTSRITPRKFDNKKRSKSPVDAPQSNSPVSRAIAKAREVVAQTCAYAEDSTDSQTVTTEESRPVSYDTEVTTQTGNVFPKQNTASESMRCIG